MRWPQPTAHASMKGLPSGTDMENSKDGSLEIQTTVLAVPVTTAAQKATRGPHKNSKGGQNSKGGGQKGGESLERKRQLASTRISTKMQTA